MPAFLCSVPLPVSRPLFLFCRMLSGLFVCLFPGIGCRLSFVLCPSLYLGPCFYSAMENCLDLAIRTGGAAGSDAPTQTFIRPFRMSFPRHQMPVFFPLYGEVRSSLLRFNPATISRPLRTSTSRLFRMSIPRHSMPAFILSIVPWRIALTWQFEREEPRGAMLRPRL